MTEGEWLACTDPQRLLDFLRGKASERKLRLFACACCRPVVDFIPTPSEGLLPGPAHLRYIEVTERSADGIGTAEEWEAAYKMAARFWQGPVTDAVIDLYRGNASSAAKHAVKRTQAIQGSGSWPAQSQLLRDVFGNPFRPITADPRWLTSTAVGLARTIYEERAFDRLPILADALEDTGCDDAELLAHCRGDGPHVRGCWVIDLLLGKG